MSSNKVNCCTNTIKLTREDEVKESNNNIINQSDENVSGGSNSKIKLNGVKSDGDNCKSINNDEKGSRHEINTKNLNGKNLHINYIQIRFQKDSHDNKYTSSGSSSNTKSRTSAKRNRVERPNSTSKINERVKCDDNNRRMDHHRHRHSHSHSRRDRDRKIQGQSVINSSSRSSSQHSSRRNCHKNGSHGMPIITIPIQMMSNFSVICSSQKFLVVANTTNTNSSSSSCCHCSHETKSRRESKEKSSQNLHKNERETSSVPKEQEKIEDSLASTVVTQQSKINVNEEDNKKESSDKSRDTSVELLSTPPTIKGTTEGEIPSPSIHVMTKRRRKCGTMTRKVSRSSSSSSSSSSSAQEEDKTLTTLTHDESPTLKKKKHGKDSSGKRTKKSRHRHH